MGLPARLPTVGPEIVHGIEINPLAAELARTTIWIGDIQWSLRNGIYARPEPILRRLDLIECRDALVATREDAGYEEAQWPEAEFIEQILYFWAGSSCLAQWAKNMYAPCESGFRVRLSEFSDLVCYWFEKANKQLDADKCKRVGLGRHQLHSWRAQIGACSMK